MERDPIDEQRAKGWLDQRYQIGQAQAIDRGQIENPTRGLGNVRADARKRIMGEWDNHLAETPAIPVVLFEPMNPGHTTGDARKRIMRGGGLH